MKRILLLCFFVSTAITAICKDYKGAELRTNESFLYGRFEVKMKSFAGSGMLMSFFTFYDQPDFAQNWNEIDIEILGRYNNEVQFNAIEGNHQMHEHRQVLNFNPHEDFHVYAFDWTPDYIAWSVDGVEVFRQSGEHISRMNRPQKIMMNAWISEFYDWTGPFSDASLPVAAQYDFVKYYEYASDKTFKLKWTDNFDRWDTERWSAASHTFDGNKVDFTRDNIKIKNGKLFLELTKEPAPAIPKANQPEENSVGKGEIQLVKKINEKQLQITFRGNTYAPNVKQKYFKVDGKEVLKTKLHYDLKTLDIFLSEPLNEQSTHKLEYQSPGVEKQELDID